MARFGKIGSGTSIRAAATVKSILGTCPSLRAFLRSRKGGGMLIACASALAVLALVGSLMTNYAWRELQWEELRTALRAAVSSTGPLLAGAGDSAIDEQIRNRIAEFAQGAASGLRLNPTDVTVAHDTGTGVTTISVAGTYVLQGIWTVNSSEGDSDDTADAIDESIAVKLEAERYEVAVALDVSGSMGLTMSIEEDGTRVSRLDSLKTAMDQVADVMETASSTAPGSLLVSLVPYTSAVNVADTGTAGRTPAKERYLRMLAGAPGADETITDTLRAAKDAVDDGAGQWVDTFHHYGVGNDPGPLRQLGLPENLLDDSDWNLRRTDVELDVSAEVPSLDKWVVDDEDFWNGCVMARWGAYWDSAARPVGWVADDSTNWPATKGAEGWSPGSASLPNSTPLHLSDAPPDADDPHTLFTAYSWPDARIGGQADHRLQTVMARLLDQGPNGLRVAPNYALNNQFPDRPTQADNDWSVSGGRSGATLCPSSSITPLTADFAALRQAVTNLRVEGLFAPTRYTGVAGTYLNLGIVWGLRTISPLWQRVWQVHDLQGVARPAVPCAPGEADGGCNPLLHKSILIISDGASAPGEQLRARLAVADSSGNPGWADSAFCTRYFNTNLYLKAYHEAAREDNEADFNNHFSGYLSNGTFGGTNMNLVLDAFQILDRWQSDTPARRNLRKAVLEDLTPWQLFRGLDAGATDALMNEANEFGFDRRPVQVGHLCRPSSMFGPYGRTDDRVLVGNTSTVPATPVAPVADVAPFNLAGLAPAIAGDGTPGSGSFGYGDVYTTMAGRLDDWFVESCRIAGVRRVRVNAIFIGDEVREARQIATLERCVDAAGGTSGRQDVFVTPDAEAIQEAFSTLFTVRRNLRFLD